MRAQYAQCHQRPRIFSPVSYSGLIMLLTIPKWLQWPQALHPHIASRGRKELPLFFVSPFVCVCVSLSLFFYLHNLYTVQCGAQTHDSKIKSCMLFRLSQPSLFLKTRNPVPESSPFQRASFHPSSSYILSQIND